MMLIDTLWEIFGMFNFRSLRRVQNLANYENFPIYGISLVLDQKMTNKEVIIYLQLTHQFHSLTVVL